MISRGTPLLLCALLLGVAWVARAETPYKVLDVDYRKSPMPLAKLVPALRARVLAKHAERRLHGAEEVGWHEVIEDHGLARRPQLEILGHGGVALVAAVTPDTDLLAGALIEEAKKTVGGGGKPADDLAVAGGKDAGALDAALDQARAAAGIG